MKRPPVFKLPIGSLSQTTSFLRERLHIDVGEVFSREGHGVALELLGARSENVFDEPLDVPDFLAD